MRQADVLYKNEPAGLLTQLGNVSFVFRYHDNWFQEASKPTISLTLPKSQQEYQSEYFFPFFIICYRKVLINKQFVLNYG